MKRKHFYEVVSENSACKLHLDLEYYKDININVLYKNVAPTVRKMMLEFLYEKYDIKLVPENVVILDSSDATRFSAHLIFNGAIFRNNIECGILVKEFIDEKITDSITVKDKSGNITTVIDASIYTKNRQFRIYKSSKYGQARPFVVSECDLSLMYLEDKYDKHDIDTKFFEYTLLNAKNENINILMDEKKKPEAKKMKHSSFPDIDGIISDKIKPGKILSCEQKPDGSIFYEIGGTRYCGIAGRNHTSNRIYIKVNSNKTDITQLCYSPKCSKQHFLLHKFPSDEDKLGEHNMDSEWGEDLSPSTLSQIQKIEK